MGNLFESSLADRPIANALIHVHPKHGNRDSSDSGRFARQCCVVQAQKCAKLWCQHIFARGTSYKEELDPREGSLGMGHFVRFAVVLRTF